MIKYIYILYDTSRPEQAIQAVFDNQRALLNWLSNMHDNKVFDVTSPLIVIEGRMNGTPVDHDNSEDAWAYWNRIEGSVPKRNASWRERDEAIICLGIGQTAFLAGSPAARAIDNHLIPEGLARLIRQERRPNGRKVYELTDAGVNVYKQLEMQNGSPFCD